MAHLGQPNQNLALKNAAEMQPKHTKPNLSFDENILKIVPFSNYFAQPVLISLE